MNKYPVVFRNKGLIDPRSIYTFGVSAKDSDNAIGFFGTGLKYAIAILLRHGLEIEIWVGKERHRFTAVETSIRDTEFKLVHMDGKPLGFTTELGKTWQLWQAFREIYCNMMDEHGTLEMDHSSFFSLNNDETLVAVYGEEFKKVAASFHDYIIDPAIPIIFEANGVQALPGPSKHIYYQGIRAYELPKQSYFTYNIKKKMDLTEDRTLKYFCYIQQNIAHSVAATTDKRAIETIVTMPDTYFEQSLDFSYTGPSTHFHEVVISLVRQFKGVNKSAQKICQTSILDSLAGVSESELCKIDRMKVDRSIQFLKKLGHDVSKYPIIVTDFLGEGILGRACNDKIYISKRTIMQGTKQIAATILEEYVHLQYKLADETYAMQTFLFDMVIGLGEQVLDEPL